MRGIALLPIAAALASCAAAPQPGRSAEAELHFQKLIAGKVAGPAVSCLPSHRSNDMVIIDGQTVAFRDGSRRVWVTDLGQGCANLGSGFYALVTKRFGGTGLCRGDIAHVADLNSGFTVGSCVMGDFVPYEKIRG
ncbi:MAG TPA: hypothetical protein VFS45_04185 [Sphingomicrobium sp.]|nr:hypothetical protein [Sphingomicrobium sp.]